jgi:ribonuclease P protein component
MLPAERRVRRREDFAAAVRDGRRAGLPGLVVHAGSTTHSGPARAGFVIGRPVGNAVTRNRLRRQLRHLIGPRLGELAPGTDIVVRVLPAAAGLSRRELAVTLSALLDRSLRSAAT